MGGDKASSEAESIWQTLAYAARMGRIITGAQVTTAVEEGEALKRFRVAQSGQPGRHQNESTGHTESSEERGRVTGQEAD